MIKCLSHWHYDIQYSMEGKGKEMAKALPQEGKILLEKLSLHAHGFGGWGQGVVVSGGEEGKEDKRAMGSIKKPLKLKSIGLLGE